MRKFEYKNFYHTLDNYLSNPMGWLWEDKPLFAFLNELGDQGWEVISYSENHGFTTLKGLVFFCKREKIN
jgi:hypothetical protein